VSAIGFLIIASKKASTAHPLVDECRALVAQRLRSRTRSSAFGRMDGGRTGSGPRHDRVGALDGDLRKTMSGDVRTPKETAASRDISPDPQADLATHLLERRALALRTSLVMLVPLAVVAVIASLVTPIGTPGTSMLLGAIAFGGGGIGTYLVTRIRRGISATTAVSDGKAGVRRVRRHAREERPGRGCSDRVS